MKYDDVEPGQVWHGSGHDREIVKIDPNHPESEPVEYRKVQGDPCATTMCSLAAFMRWAQYVVVM